MAKKKRQGPATESLESNAILFKHPYLYLVQGEDGPYEQAELLVTSGEGKNAA